MVSRALVPIKHNEVNLGKALPWPVYDEQGKLLLTAGSVIETQGQLDNIIQHGFCPEFLWNDVPPKQAVSPKLARPPSSSPPQEEKQEESKDQMIDLDSVKWNVGETLYLQSHDNATLRYTVKLIGFAKHKSVIVSAPTTDGRSVIVRDGQTFIVRAFPGQKAYAFTASAIKSVYTPFPYLHLSYPTTVRCTVIRKGARASVKIIASVSVDGTEHVGAATLNDLSTGGASGIMKAPLGLKGQTGTLKFKVNAAGNDEYLSINMVLRSVALVENGEGFRHGFEFQDVPNQAKLILSAFVHQCLAEGE